MNLIFLIAVAALAGSVLPASAATLYSEDFQSFATGTVNPADWWSFHGPGSVTASLTVQSSGIGGSQALEMNVDASGAFGTDWYFYAGVGRSDIVPAGSLAAFAPGDITLSLDIALFGATVAPDLGLFVTQFSGDKVWETRFNPVLPADGSFTHLDLNLGQGTLTGAWVWDPTLAISINSVSFNSTGFPLAAGNRVILDNVVISVIPEPTAIALLTVAAVFATRRRSR
ncbi:MAG TPA: PEP-CTERM sorting domain-containing protein [Verrucomicrobiae bacterium]|nr:PEP-CTERM sorting domain-containing protein [Verrucomicrobiae bacterium]